MVSGLPREAASAPTGGVRSGFPTDCHWQFNDAWEIIRAANTYLKTGRENFPADGTSRITVELAEDLGTAVGEQYFRAHWVLD